MIAIARIPEPAMRRIELIIETIIFQTRWILAPFYLGLAFCLLLLLYHFGVQIFEFVAQVEAEQTPEHVHFRAGAFPVLSRERVEREGVHTQPGTVLYDGAHPLNTGAMPGKPGQTAPLGPAAVSIHDDGDVTRHLRNASGNVGVRNLGPIDPGRVRHDVYRPCPIIPS